MADADHPDAGSAYLAWAGIGAGDDLIEVAARNFLQRLGSDETLSRVLGALETPAAGNRG